AVVGGQFFRVTALVDSPARLLHASFLYRVAAVNRRRRQRHSQSEQAPAPDTVIREEQFEPICESTQNHKATQAPHRRSTVTPN
ncbi:MAG TPA: hypothetical protein VMU34_15110, partial [Mycobacterium sp.]|nr:hypothetical protein [Mycobacterium sp.]